ncbi:unnamed protein product (macronuclear) [Paramecium tetraurelia]|uniref:Signal recognition particle receptor subunit beta n=1 Tax=Paramecium tetraurelia TaxID=5888 RepID=A0EGZ0_PARTE|nr:uncharacterized protein GSPATT00026905001 [Paramecium tetraurelia]CAK94581.1 unnamed protein product [Paramecium tetraurelia]|eukprot:XP_001461954.1 hypothetical protein (macronuclear) [Paramecium tetraurelia strain d4-2]
MYFIIALFVIIFAAAFWIVSKNKSRGQTINADNSVIFIVGDKNAGKTSLLYCLSNQNSSIQTTNSIEPNQTELIKQNNQSVIVVDVPGNIYQKEQFLNKIQEANKIILVKDSSETSQIGATGVILYNILISIPFQKSRIPILIVLNKQDKEKAYKAPDFEMFLSREMQICIMQFLKGNNTKKFDNRWKTDAY